MRGSKTVFPSRELTDKERKNFSILDTIRTKGPIAKTDISKFTGLNIVTVSNYIDSYIKKGLVTEEGFDSSSGGRKPMMVNLNKKAAYVVGLGFGMTDMIGVITDLRCGIISEVRTKKPADSGKSLIDTLIHIADELLSNFSEDKDKIKGIGLGVAGIIDKENRTVRCPGPLGTQDGVISVSLWDEFTKKFGIPLLIENDADCAVFGEQWLALNPDYKNIIYMYSGVACGIMINGQVYTGTSGCAGELGILNPNALDSYDCENYGYGLGRWSIELGMLDNIKEHKERHKDSKIFKLAKNKIENINVFVILEAAKEGDELAIQLLTKAGEDLGKKVAFLVNLLNPQVVVIGGGIEKAGPPVMNSLKKTVKEWSFDEASRNLKIIPAQLSENAVPLGAASLVIRNYFENI